MVREHKKQQIAELQKLDIKIDKKHVFSKEFSKELHEFSKQHHKESIKEFRESWQEWISLPLINEFIQNELEKMENKEMETIYISARFYYRKKEKRDKKEKEKEEKKDKPYIGFSKDFIYMMDNYIQSTIKEKQNIAFDRFIKQYTNEISNEFGILKQKYDNENIPFIAKDIANKLKKAFQNRYYSICLIIRKKS